MYVSYPKQFKIRFSRNAKKLLKALLSCDIEEQLETVKCCKMCDLEDTINVQKYYTK